MDDTRALVGLARTGDDRAFEQLIEPLMESSFRLACGILMDRAAAEDALQEATFKAWRAMPRVRPDTTSLRSWFLTIVANESRGLLRRRRRSALSLPLELISRGTGPEAAATDQLDIAQALRRLDPRSRAAVVLRFYTGLSFGEIAEVLGGSSEAAKSRVHRALRAMRPFVEPEEADRS